jgi:hypothetical protein
MEKKMGFLAKSVLVLLLSMALLLAGCAAGQKGPASSQVAANVAQVAATAPDLAHQLDSVYAFLVAQKAIPDNTAEATKALAALDTIAPMVQQGATALQGDNINWIQFVLEGAITAARIFGYVAPFL